MQGPDINALQELTRLILVITLGGNDCNYPHLVDNGTEREAKEPSRSYTTREWQSQASSPSRTGQQWHPYPSRNAVDGDLTAKT